ncbi:prenyltransferase/squalene oxidase repeat-containing protein [Methylotetracoccus oryzae]|uniref:hypothetical protein n=1 Tax=Methylotetracoccus oryzae TaxID=1919059 RepID=UPI0013A55D41|nr:hypothetical protein [Methylotetracoccus oryzae]
MSVKQSFAFKYSASCNRPTLYASAYACMIYSLLGKLDELSGQAKSSWIQYFDSFQNADDGLYYDPVLDSENYPSEDWWGARHLALHMISAYTDLGGTPKMPFHFLEAYYDVAQLKRWLEGFNWHGSIESAGDLDNKIMNIGCALQYQRDAWNDEHAGKAIRFIQTFLAEQTNSNTGLWCTFNQNDPVQLSRAVQFAYHLFPLFFYDEIPIRNADRIVELVLRTQNSIGGFGVCPNSSACEDIDSVDLLIRLAALVPEKQREIRAALARAFNWVLVNQVADGGFVFRLSEPFVYGHPEMASSTNEGAMFPTWFRTLCVAYLAEYFKVSHSFRFMRCPGYEF